MFLAYHLTATKGQAAFHSHEAHGLKCPVVLKCGKVVLELINNLVGN